MASEFERQRETLLSKGHADLVGMTAAQFVDLVEPLREAAEALEPSAGGGPADGRVPFVLVLSGALVPAVRLIPLLHLVGSALPGILDRNHGEAGLAPYRPLPDLGVPDASVYLLTDIERGDEFRNIRPEGALAVIRSRGRTPLTIHEGIALVTLFPEVLVKNHCFMLSGSRRGDRRVPAIWISGKAPKLGWCWDGNPHTWLGSASAGGRAA
jgi:Family of unknown function (DUF5701)